MLVISNPDIMPPPPPLRVGPLYIREDGKRTRAEEPGQLPSKIPDALRTC